MDWLLFLLFPGLLILYKSHTMGEPSFCTSCDEYVDDTCRRNLGVCHPRYPDFACQTKEVYIQLNTGEYLYKYSILGCPRRCVEYVRFIKFEKNIFSCCNESYCNSFQAKHTHFKENNFV
ncbi:uncharacterized protein LOC100359924 precursor [Rattus norvegicus]|uniref:Prostate and testis expressed 10 n=1 Tax=Rattus norvegicus TaxID=10116 RepID=H9LAA7_RAT|nr:uncharacterized protein LOC100359924 precursor [Rattus norvegicus]ADX68810.1 prostate and testis expressed N [Rattus norvegicus]|eukprot:NP_001252515.1 uncharacterized protein LOC100359924 precursor [Rattus norvegicus]